MRSNPPFQARGADVAGLRHLLTLPEFQKKVGRRKLYRKLGFGPTKKHPKGIKDPARTIRKILSGETSGVTYAPKVDKQVVKYRGTLPHYPIPKKKKPSKQAATDAGYSAQAVYEALAAVFQPLSVSLAAHDEPKKAIRGAVLWIDPATGFGDCGASPPFDSWDIFSVVVGIPLTAGDAATRRYLGISELYEDDESAFTLGWYKRRWLLLPTDDGEMLARLGIAEWFERIEEELATGSGDEETRLLVSFYSTRVARGTYTGYGPEGKTKQMILGMMDQVQDSLNRNENIAWTAFPYAYTGWSGK